MSLRTEIPVSYVTMVKRTIVLGLQAVFDANYSDPEFKSIRIVPDWPTDRIDYPFIEVIFNEGPIENFGIAHKEWFKDQYDIVREWKHRIFHGSLDFEIYAESILTRDILGDALIEVLSQFNTGQIDKFYNTIYGAPNDPYSALALLAQLNLNTDRITPTGNNVTLAPWLPEDVMIYQKGYSVDISGGFYNTPPLSTLPGTTYISDVDVYPYIFDTTAPLAGVDPDNPWLNPFIYFDSDAVQGMAVITSTNTP